MTRQVSQVVRGELLHAGLVADASQLAGCHHVVEGPAVRARKHEVGVDLGGLAGGQVGDAGAPPAAAELQPLGGHARAVRP
ncbi:MAG: hypothetical protein ACRDYA_10425 [Egibacteraceae bacterium]